MTSPILQTTPAGLYTGPLAGEPLWSGFDVSVNQDPNSLNWEAARESGQRFVMVRGAYGTKTDHHAPLHVGRARDADILPGLYFFPTEAPLEAQWVEVLNQSEACDIGPGDIAPAFDLEPFDGISRLPSDIPAYLQTVETLLRRSQERFGMVWVYTSIGFWEQMGYPKGWLDFDWWKAQWGKSEPPDSPCRWAAWQAGWMTPDWARGGQRIDDNRARFLPLVQPAKVAA